MRSQRASPAGRRRTTAKALLQPWGKVFKSPTVASLIEFYGWHGIDRGYTIQVLEQQIPRSRVALRSALHALIEADLLREERSGVSFIYSVAHPERLLLLREYIAQSSPVQPRPSTESQGMLWARSILNLSGPRRKGPLPGLHEPGSAVVELGGMAESDAVDRVEDAPRPRIRPAVASRRQRGAGR